MIGTRKLEEIAAHCAAISDSGSNDAGAREHRLLHLSAWYTVLLQQTLEWAQATVPFYRERYAGNPRLAAERFHSIQDLAQVPVITRVELSSELERFVSTGASIDGASSTSGTTGRRQLVYTSGAEDRAMAAFRRIQAGPAAEDAGPLVLRIIPGSRRTHVAQTSSHVPQTAVITVGYPFTQAPAWFDYTDHLIEVLAERYMIGGRQRRVSILHVTPPMLIEIITRHLLHKHIQPKMFEITDIMVSGALLSRQTHAMITDIWGARCHHSYSCAEISGEAREDPETADSFLVPPTFYCEILDPVSHEQVRAREAGLVVITSLYPFQQAMPLIRYANGDIAQRVDDGSQPFVQALRPIGRMGEVIALGQRQMIGARDAFHAITAFAELPQIPYPRFRVTLNAAQPSHVSLEVEVTLHGYSPTGLTAEHVAEKHLEEIRRYGFRGTLLPETVSCTFLPKNSIPAFPKIVPDR